jgi:hypothetical protein
MQQCISPYAGACSGQKPQFIHFELLIATKGERMTTRAQTDNVSD